MAERVRALDGLRALAVTSVIGIHAGGLLPGGYYGVDMFFVLSGFLITGILRREVIATGRIDRLRFLERRARRLLPALLVACAFITAVALLGWSQQAGMWWGLGFSLLYVMDFGRAFVNGGLFGITWSLAVEEQFYILMPFVLLAVQRWRPAAILRLLLVIFVASWLLRLAVFAYWHRVYLPQGDTKGIYLLYDTHYEPLLIGAALALAYEAGMVRHLRERWAVAALVVLAALFVTPGPNTFLGGVSFAFGFTLTGLATAVLMVVLLQGGRVARLFSWRPAAYVGLVSYGIYLFHMPLLAVLTQLHVTGKAALVPAFLGSVALAALSFEVLERRFHRPSASSALPVDVEARIP